ncbi:MAG: hypothetical protein BWX48_02110 [Verrucomicrobia bacterium ADurb.Bin006]|nr:MAG: hypothetical protein BWX48_02110 [Verrucomicrobia bacterium ADurb.Bin006]
MDGSISMSEKLPESLSPNNVVTGASAVQEVVAGVAATSVAPTQTRCPLRPPFGSLHPMCSGFRMRTFTI